VVEIRPLESFPAVLAVFEITALCKLNGTRPETKATRLAFFFVRL